MSQVSPDFFIPRKNALEEHISHNDFEALMANWVAIERHKHGGGGGLAYNFVGILAISVSDLWAAPNPINFSLWTMSLRVTSSSGPVQVQVLKNGVSQGTLTLLASTSVNESSLAVSLGAKDTLQMSLVATGTGSQGLVVVPA